ncbi:hypothetical protein HPT27_07100 [Permianibacter sp. IMCC34836]|nr:hypothetical protein [Permianibacter fluminis]
MWNALALLMVLLAFAYAAKKLLPATWLARWSGKPVSTAGQCGGGCNGCGSAAAVRKSHS